MLDNNTTTMRDNVDVDRGAPSTLGDYTSVGSV